MKTASVLLVVSLCILGAPWRGEAGLPARDAESADRSLTRKFSEEPAGSSEWTPGSPHPSAPNVIASAEKNQWTPVPGYRWLNPGNPRDLRVEALPFGGIGAALGVNPADGLPQVATVLPASPAEAAGLKAGMVILSVDSTSTSGKSLADCVRLIRGEVGSTVFLETYDGVSKTTHIFSIERGLIDPK